MPAFLMCEDPRAPPTPPFPQGQHGGPAEAELGMETAGRRTVLEVDKFSQLCLLEKEVFELAEMELGSGAHSPDTAEKLEISSPGPEVFEDDSCVRVPLPETGKVCDQRGRQAASARDGEGVRSEREAGCLCQRRGRCVIREGGRVPLPETGKVCDQRGRQGASARDGEGVRSEREAGCLCRRRGRCAIREGGRAAAACDESFRTWGVISPSHLIALLKLVTSRLRALAFLLQPREQRFPAQALWVDLGFCTGTVVKTCLISAESVVRGDIDYSTVLLGMLVTQDVQLGLFMAVMPTLIQAGTSASSR
ncbi:hypothetical protein P7K49_000047 [Saguinus oedipus]|uniref:Uncharacterized protein n=1 Tax=Saguinus oedipus TaxID=9490 RepID=A0ABQ9WAL1_SAGOE|nr:hypothetical protein P7K49_000047 [Saguinus oedipus]